MSANEVQHGGNHYKKQKIQVWDFITANDIPYLEGNAIKYLSRWWDKGGLEDLLKARHYVDKIIENEQKRLADNMAETRPDGVIGSLGPTCPAGVNAQSLEEQIFKDASKRCAEHVDKLIQDGHGFGHADHGETMDPRVDLIHFKFDAGHCACGFKDAMAECTYNADIVTCPECKTYLERSAETIGEAS